MNLFTIKNNHKKKFWKACFPTNFFSEKKLYHNLMLFEVFDSITDGWLKTRFKTWHAPKTLKIIQLNLNIWHVLGISIPNQTNFKKLPQNMTCLKILAQNLTRFENLVSKCEAARKIWLIKMCFFLQKKISESSFSIQHEGANCIVFTVWDDPEKLFF